MIILPSWLITSAKEPPRREWGVRVEGACIADAAPNEQLASRYPDDEVWHAPGHVLAPGFVDAHTHLYGVLAHGIPVQDVPSGIMAFLEHFWWPKVEDRLDREMICAATRYNNSMMIRSGITSFYDCEEAPNALPGILEAQAEAVCESGLRGVLSFEATQRVSPENGELGLLENLHFLEASRSGGGLVSGMMCFHTTFTCGAGFIRQAYRLAEQMDAAVHAHCSEGIFEPDYTRQHFGLLPIEYYQDLGVLGSRSLLSQCVQVSPAEIELLAKRGARVTHMPLSNCEVGAGVAPVPDMLNAGIPVGLGSDGYITDFFEVMRGAFLIHKAHRQSTQVMPAWQVWSTATEGGAAALGLEGVGRLAPGWQADLQLIKPHLPSPLDEHNLYEQTLLYCRGSNVTGTMVAGKVLMRDGVIAGADPEGQRQEVYRLAGKLWQAG